MKYVKYFPTETEYTVFKSSGNYIEPHGSYVEATDVIHYNDPEYKLLNTPLTFDILTSGNILWKGSSKTIEYSKNGGTWTSITGTSAGAEIPVTVGDSVKFRGDNSSYDGSVKFNSADTTFKISGNIMSMLDSDGFASMTALTGYGGTFSNFFNGCIGLVDASKLILPATTLVPSCYQTMFNGCTNLVNGPAVLPAMDLSSFAMVYGNMFQGCTALVKAPELPATILGTNSYYEMFMNCTSLVRAPELPATTLTMNCYYELFRGCSSLNYVKALFTTTPGTNGSTSYWLNGVAATGTFVRNSEATWQNSITPGVDTVPSGWTITT